jgi:hypothetical protein
MDHGGCKLLQDKGVIFGKRKHSGSQQRSKKTIKIKVPVVFP